MADIAACLPGISSHPGLRHGSTEASSRLSWDSCQDTGRHWWPWKDFFSRVLAVATGLIALQIHLILRSSLAPKPLDLDDSCSADPSLPWKTLLWRYSLIFSSALSSIVLLCQSGNFPGQQLYAPKHQPQPKHTIAWHPPITTVLCWEFRRQVSATSNSLQRELSFAPS